MTAYFVDTSAIAKRYLVETGAAWMRGLCVRSSRNVIVISALTTIEFLSLLARQQRERRLTPAQVATLENAFMIDYRDEYLSVPLEDPVLSHRRHLVKRHPLRPPDAIQLASAIFVANFLNEPLTFICADMSLLTAAQAEGFAVDNPNAHP
jgi:hypothetical protein